MGVSLASRAEFFAQPTQGELFGTTENAKFLGDVGHDFREQFGNIAAALLRNGYGDETAVLLIPLPGYQAGLDQIIDY